MRAQLEKLDDLVYRCERMLVVGALVVMSIVVFLDVVHRTFAGEDNAFVEVLVKVAGLFGRTIEPDTPAYANLEIAAPILLWVGFVWLAYFGIRTATRQTPIAPPRALVYAVVGVVGAYGLVRLMITLMPNGFIWSQPLALVLTLWVGFIGASMCTHDKKHLKVEAVQRYLPVSVRPYIAGVSGLVTTAVTVALMWLSLRYVVFNYDEYVATEGQGGLFIGLDAPKYLCFAALPVAFALMAVRFAARSVLAFGGDLDVADPLEGIVDENKRIGAGEIVPSEVPTQVGSAPMPVAAEDRRESEIPTEVVSVSTDDAPGPLKQRDHASKARPSEVPTDPHRIVSDEVSGSIGDDAGGDR